VSKMPPCGSHTSWFCCIICWCPWVCLPCWSLTCLGGLVTSVSTCSPSWRLCVAHGNSQYTFANWMGKQMDEEMVHSYTFLFSQVWTLTLAFRLMLTSINSFRVDSKWISHFMLQKKCKFKSDHRLGEIRTLSSVSFQMHYKKKKKKRRQKLLNAKFPWLLCKKQRKSLSFVSRCLSFLKKKLLAYNSCMGGYIVIFTYVPALYLSWVYSLPCSPSSPHPS
jgi:hypothetical protein